MRKVHKNDKIALALIIGFVLVSFLCLGGIAYNALSGTTNPGTGVEVEDCDAEDFRNREADCGFIQPNKTVAPKIVKTTAPAKPAPAKPAPAKTTKKQ